ncbi:MAG: hypothetical protein ABSD13_07490 [Candidatus Korobacteraceae bacterium]|jgi:hypothetical protein
MRKVLALLVVMAAAASAQQFRALPDTPAWKSLQTLVGKWDGTVKENGKQASHVEVRRTGGGSALMHVINEGTPDEMVTMFHPDMNDLLATHYCSAHNQPRMKLVSSTATRLVFEFMDGTNIGPKDGHMVGLAIDLIDANHHDEEWSWTQDGKRSTSVFHYTRAAEN